MENGGGGGGGIIGRWQETVRHVKQFYIGPIVMHIKEGRKEMFYLTTHSTHFIYGYMASDIW